MVKGHAPSSHVLRTLDTGSRVARVANNVTVELILNTSTFWELVHPLLSGYFFRRPGSIINRLGLDWPW